MLQARKLWITLSGIGVVLALLVLAPMLIDWSSFKPRIVAAVSEATGRDVRVEGPLRLQLLPSPRLVATGVRIGGFGAAKEPLLAAEKIAVAVELLPLFRKQLDVRYVIIDRPVVTLVRYPDGTSNWARLEQDATPDPQLAIRDFRISEGTLVYRNATGEETRIDDANLAIDIAAISGPFGIEGTVAMNRQPLGLDVTLGETGQLDATITLADDAGLVTLKGQVPKGDAPVTARLAIKAPTLDGFLAALPSEPDPEAEDDDKKPAPAMARAFEADGNITQTADGWNIKGLRFALGETRGQADLAYGSGVRSKIRGTVRLNQFVLDDFQSPEDDPDKPSLPIELDLPDSLDADITLAAAQARWKQVRLTNLAVPLTLNAGVLNLPQLSLTLPGGTRASGLARIRSIEGKADIAASFAFTSAALPQLLAAVDVKPPLGGLGAARASGTVRVSGTRVQLGDLKASALGSSLTGSATMEMDPARQSTRVVATIDQLDLRRIRPAPADKGSRSQSGPLDFQLAIGRLTTEGSSHYRAVSATGRLSGEDLALTAARIGDMDGMELTAKGTIAQATSDDRRPDLDFTFRSAKLAGSGHVSGPMNRLDTRVAATLAGASVKAAGWVDAKAPQPQYNLDTSITAPEATRVFAALRETPAAGPVKPLGALAGAATVRSDGPLVRLDGLKLTIGKTAVTGTAALDRSRAVPVLTANLSAGRLDLSAFGDDTSAAAARADPGQRWSRDPLPVDGIRALDGSISLTAEEILYGGYALRAPRIKLAFPGDRLVIEQFSGRMLDGAVSLKGSLDAGPATPVLTLAIDMTDVPLATVMRSFAATTPATGTLGFHANVRSTGRSQQELVGSLAGSGRFAAENGVIDKIDVKAVNDRMKTLRTVNDFIRFASTALKGGQTQYRSLSTGLAIQNGIARLTDAKSDMDGADMTASGTVDLPRWRADLAGQIRLQDHADAPPIGFAVKGPIGQTVTSYDLAAIQKFFATRVLAAGLRAVVDKEGFDPRDLAGIGKDKPAAEGAAAPTQKDKTKAAIGAIIGAATGKKAATQPPAQTPSGGATGGTTQPAPAAPPKSAEDDVKDLLKRGIGGLIKKKKPAEQPASQPAPAPAEPVPAEKAAPDGYSLSPQ